MLTLCLLQEYYVHYVLLLENNVFVKRTHHVIIPKSILSSLRTPTAIVRLS